MYVYVISNITICLFVKATTTTTTTTFTINVTTTTITTTTTTTTTTNTNNINIKASRIYGLNPLRALRPELRPKFSLNSLPDFVFIL